VRKIEQHRAEGANRRATYIPSGSWREGHFSSRLFPLLSLRVRRRRFRCLACLRHRTPIGIDGMDPSEVPPAAVQTPHPQMAAPTSSAAPATSPAPSGSTIVKKRKRAGTHLVTRASSSHAVTSARTRQTSAPSAMLCVGFSSVYSTHTDHHPPPPPSSNSKPPNVIVPRAVHKAPSSPLMSPSR
jgi:hypothetical protein